MKKRIIYVIIFLLLVTLLQANSAIFRDNHSVDHIDEHDNVEPVLGAGKGMPEQIALDFSPLQLDPLELGEVKPDWKLIKKIALTELDNNPVQIDVYDSSPTAGSIEGNYIGMLTYQDKEYTIPMVAHALVENDALACPQLCLHNYEFHNQKLTLFAAIDISSNGPGLKKYFIYDKQHHTITSIDLWGESYFIDLDQDGVEEWIVQFEGLHLSMPDVSIIRQTEQGIQWTESIVSSLDDNLKYAALIDLTSEDLIFSVTKFIGDDMTSEVTEQYRYAQNQLVK